MSVDEDRAWRSEADAHPQVRQRYHKTAAQTMEMYRTMQREMQAVAALPCAPALGVHRPFCECESNAG